MLEKLGLEKACGTDEVHPHVLKSCAKEFSGPLSVLFRRSFAEGLVPRQWKDANVSPIFKKGSRIIAANYRPVSLTSVVCKVLERLIRDRIAKYLEAENLLSTSQHGFVKGRSCTTNLLETLDVVTKSLADGYAVNLIYLDFLKAFDMVPHRRLLLKLKGYGFKTDLLNWLESFLSNRRQRVVLGDSVSEWKSVTKGVPQGSVLGPLLFLLFINDMPELFSNQSKLYAEDSKIIAMIEDIGKALALQNDINALTDWTKNWLMRLNVSKCKVMYFGKAEAPRIVYSMEDVSTGTRVPLEVSNCERDLGINISSDMRWHTHISSIVSKANKIMGLLLKTFTSRDQDLWKLLYTSIIRPHLEYGSVVWNPYLRSDIEAIERV